MQPLILFLPVFPSPVGVASKPAPHPWLPSSKRRNSSQLPGPTDFWSPGSCEFLPRMKKQFSSDTSHYYWWECFPPAIPVTCWSEPFLLQWRQCGEAPPVDKKHVNPDPSPSTFLHVILNQSRVTLSLWPLFLSGSHPFSPRDARRRIVCEVNSEEAPDEVTQSKNFWLTKLWGNFMTLETQRIQGGRLIQT